MSIRSEARSIYNFGPKFFRPFGEDIGHVIVQQRPTSAQNRLYPQCLKTRHATWDLENIFAKFSANLLAIFVARLKG
jgi:hypothetical protein